MKELAMTTPSRWQSRRGGFADRSEIFEFLFKLVAEFIWRIFFVECARIRENGLKGRPDEIQIEITSKRIPVCAGAAGWQRRSTAGKNSDAQRRQRSRARSFVRDCEKRIGALEPASGGSGPTRSGMRCEHPVSPHGGKLGQCAENPEGKPVGYEEFVARQDEWLLRPTIARTSRLIERRF